MKLFYMLLLLLIVGFFGLIGWMNLTPGHFQLTGCCQRKAIYVTKMLVSPCAELCVPYTNLWNKMLISLSSIDFYR
jgi:hypothetical protein